MGLCMMMGAMPPEEPDRSVFAPFCFALCFLAHFSPLFLSLWSSRLLPKDVHFLLHYWER